MRYLFLIMSLIIILAGARLGFCDWEYMIQVNTDNYDKQASRGVVDCPWPIASDAYGNVYTVWEDKRDPEEDPELNIYFRKKNADGTWEEDDYRVSFEEGRLYGHPSICVLPIGEEPPLLACYVGEDTRELRGNTYYEGEWGDPSYFISDEGGYLLTFSSSGWGTNIVALSDGKAYAFWQYIDGSSVKLYHNIYDDGWVTEYEKTVYDDGGADPHYSRHENARVDGDDKIHLVYADNYSGNNEIYYLYKGAQDDDFGYYLSGADLLRAIFAGQIEPCRDAAGSHH